MNAATLHRPTRSLPVRGIARPVLRVGGAALLLATALIHLHLYRSGYSGIPTIGHLFLANVVGGLGLTVAVLGIPPRLLIGRLAAIGGAAFEAGTLLGLIVTVTHGLFGFQDTSSAPDFALSIAVEALGAITLLTLALLPAGKPAAGR